MGDSLASKKRWKVGDKVVLQGGIYPGDWQFTVDGIYSVTEGSAIPRPLLFHWEYLNDAAASRRGTTWAGSSRGSTTRGARAVISAAIDKLFDDSDSRRETMSEQAFNKSFLGGFSRRPRRRSTSCRSSSSSS